MESLKILQDLILSSRINQCWDVSGIDSYKKCNDQQWYKLYPHQISYQYNSRGFRDSEWPLDSDDLKNSIWCVGDSFTVGIGSPSTHIWPQVLQNKIGTRTINVSMDGASNNWIVRKVHQIANEIAPKNIVVMWSYFHRRESADTSLDDEQRRLHECNSTDQEDRINFINCVDSIKKYSEINFVHLIVPNVQSVTDIKLSWDNFRGPDWPMHAPYTMNEFDGLPTGVKHEIIDRFDADMTFRYMLQKNEWFNQCKLKENVIEVEQMDYARDGHHFDIETSKWLVEKVLPRLAI